MSQNWHLSSDHVVTIMMAMRSECYSAAVTTRRTIRHQLVSMQLPRSALNLADRQLQLLPSIVPCTLCSVCLRIVCSSRLHYKMVIKRTTSNLGFRYDCTDQYGYLQLRVPRLPATSPLLYLWQVNIVGWKVHRTKNLLHYLVGRTLGKLSFNDS